MESFFLILFFAVNLQNKPFRINKRISINKAAKIFFGTKLNLQSGLSLQRSHESHFFQSAFLLNSHQLHELRTRQL